MLGDMSQPPPMVTLPSWPPTHPTQGHLLPKYAMAWNLNKSFLCPPKHSLSLENCPPDLLPMLPTPHLRLAWPRPAAQRNGQQFESSKLLPKLPLAGSRPSCHSCRKLIHSSRLCVQGTKSHQDLCCITFTDWILCSNKNIWRRRCAPTCKNRETFEFIESIEIVVWCVLSNCWANWFSDINWGFSV